MKSNFDEVVLVDKNDNKIGTYGKMEAHLEGKLHRAFSVFVFNSEGDLLLQKRAFNKYHSSGLWTNTCCSHPRDTETIDNAAHRRLMEELGFDCPVKEIFSFYYEVKLGDNIFEHEYDHVFIGRYDGIPKHNPEEVDTWQWIKTDKLLHEIKNNSEEYTYWFKLVINDVLNYINRV